LTVYVPGGVPGFLLPLLPPQANSKPASNSRSEQTHNREVSLFFLLLLAQPNPTSASPGSETHAAYNRPLPRNPGNGASAPDGPKVVTVSVTLLPGLTDAAESEQFTPWAVGDEQVTATGDVKPPSPAIATSNFADPPGAIVGVVDGVADKLKSGRSNVAPTVVSAVGLNVHVPVPEHGPPQPSKPEPEAAVAVRLTVVPDGNAKEHAVAGQSMPGGTLVTLPLPVPPIPRVIVGGPVNVPPMLWSAFIVMVQTAAPEQPPVHPPKTDPDPATAVSCTDVPLGKYAWQEPPCGNWQLIPGGVLVTVPVPLVFPERLTVSDGFKSKVATIWRSAVIVRSHAAVPEQA
jgi:hypothetical protein